MFNICVYCRMITTINLISMLITLHPSSPPTRTLSNRVRFYQLLSPRCDTALQTLSCLNETLCLLTNLCPTSCISSWWKTPFKRRLCTQSSLFDGGGADWSSQVHNAYEMALYIVANVKRVPGSGIMKALGVNDY